MKTHKVSTNWTDRVSFERLEAETSILPRGFFGRHTKQVARELLGKVLVHGRTAGMIVEVEAYLGLNDQASHAYRGPKGRNRVMFGPPGHAYVYFIYGMYECVNAVTEVDGTAGAVLIRALEPLCGIELMHRRRPKARSIEDLASGPGKLTIALGITRRLNRADLTAGEFTVREWRGAPPIQIDVTPRIGIRHAADWPLRFVVRGNPCCSKGPTGGR
ncbi:MAG: DNA-3-methyladenine glycosylase [Acidobacteriales bacterium]|nr:DNA-3-methyladenine glycosylase [Terriglobales bacterium]